MNGRFFLDTNIFVYSFDVNSPRKAAQARTLIRSAIETRGGIVSYQVVQEFFNVALRRFSKPCVQAGTDANERLQIGFAESHAAAVKHTVITIEETIGRIKRYLQLTTVIAAKQRAKAHTVTRMTAKVSAGRPPSCHANIAANR